ncbi:hypothetical protein [Streptomyces xantholiticus]|uniref:hypothetical protein n=1 Tax=Streptomyces xantholiticus TaxID=68285 RepID=UPI00167A8A7D|nr:hypothetical protein [Streptomyces xantholiticus]GGW41299.1 hypothetical protein GCM10010381_27690 [Streptomyces xantholiticus]
MGKAFVAKLAREGARDPEALAAWIGRKKFGKRAFQRLAKAGRDDAEEQRALMGRVRRSGRLSRDLTGFSDTELGRALQDLTPDEMARVAAEMDRRDAAARMPGARPDLIGLSDEELGQRMRDMTGAEFAAVVEEADRRQKIAEVFPDSQLADDLTGVDENTLGWALGYASPDEAARIAAEMDRRHPPAPLRPAAGAGTVRGQLDDRAAVDDLLRSNPDDWAHLSEDMPEDPRDRMTATERWIADREDAAASSRAAYSREQVREMYREHVYGQYLAAEDELRGVLLSKEAVRQGIDPMAVFTGPSHVAYARASEELKRWWRDNPRTTLAEYEEQVSGQRSEAGDRARKSGSDQQNRL